MLVINKIDTFYNTDTGKANQVAQRKTDITARLKYYADAYTVAL